jgi:hypothetical protein
MRGTELKDVEKAKIITWCEENVPIKLIAARISRGLTSVKKVIRQSKLVEHGTVPKVSPCSGRARKTTSATDRLIKRILNDNPWLSAAELNLLGNVSVRTIQNRLLKELDLPSRCAAQKPLLTKEMIRKRLQFGRRYRNWTKEQLAKVMWSAERNFSLVQKGRKRVRRPSFSGGKGRGSLYFLPKNKNNECDLYLNVVEEKMLPVFEIHEANLFMLDNAPCHT